MLYDKRWDRTETKPDVFSLEGLIAWLEKQPANKTYSWAHGTECLLGQWLRTIDSEVECQFNNPTHNLYLYQVSGDQVDLSRFETIARLDFDTDTFGAALTRARAALACSEPSAHRGTP